MCNSLFNQSLPSALLQEYHLPVFWELVHGPVGQQNLGTLPRNLDGVSFTFSRLWLWGNADIRIFAKVFRNLWELVSNPFTIQWDTLAIMN